MDHLPLTILRRAALASGLLTVEQILEAEASLRAEAGPTGAWIDIGDEPLAAKLVELGHLNFWQAEQLRVGRSRFNLGPYTVIDSLGRGGMGQVFKAEHRMMGRIVAIKVLPRNLATPDAVASFTREIRAHAQFDHQNLVRAYDAGFDGNVYYLVTEFVPGTDLRKLVRARGKLTMTDAATIVSQAARGLAYAHSRGLVHRDVKPGNLLVTPEGHTKLSDLGLSAFLDAQDAEDPRAGKVVGTADYLSPEQITAPAKVTATSDIYSLGCTLYYAISGKVPFPGGTSKDKARRHCEDMPLNPRRFNIDLSDEFIAVIAAMMAKDPRDRVQSADDVMRLLAPWAGEAVGGSLSGIGSSLDVRRPIISDAAETEPSLFDDLQFGVDEGSSQISQRTDPMASADEETLPDLNRGDRNARPHSTMNAVLTLAVLAPLALAAALLLVSLVLRALW